MKTMKKALSLMLTLVIALSLCACGANSGASKADVARVIEDVTDVARAFGYFEGFSKGWETAGNYACACPDCNCSGRVNTDTANDATGIESKPEIAKEQHLPILMDYADTWIDQNGDPMDYADAKLFFERNREYAKVAVAINSLREESQSNFCQYQLYNIYSWAIASPHNVDEYLAYEWLLSEMETDYENYLDDLFTLIGDQIDLDSSPAANVATCIILGKMLEFQDDGTYETAANPHNEHDCDTEGCNVTHDATPVNLPNTTLTNVPVISDVLEVISMSDAEIIAYLDKQSFGQVTEFDSQHPNLYFDHTGRAHGAIRPDEEYYYATTNGKVYKLEDHTDIDRIGESPLFDESLCGTYVGETNRRIK